MWNPFRTRRERLAAEKQAQRDHELRVAALATKSNRYIAEAIAKLGEQQLAMVKELAEGQKKSAEVLQTWLEGFKVYTQPESTTIRDEDEVQMAVERAMNSSKPLGPLPDGIPEEFRLAWVLRNTEDPN